METLNYLVSSSNDGWCIVFDGIWLHPASPSVEFRGLIFLTSTSELPYWCPLERSFCLRRCFWNTDTIIPLRDLNHCWRGDEETCRPALWNMKRIDKKEPASIEELDRVKLTWIIIIKDRNHLSQKRFVDATKRMRTFGYLPLFGGWTFSPQAPYNQILGKSLIRLHCVPLPTYQTLCSPLMWSAIVFEATKKNRPWLLEFDATRHWELRPRRLRALARRGRSSLRVNRTPWGILWA